MKFYDSPLSPFCARCRVQIRAKGLEERVQIIPRPEIAVFRKISVTGKIPALSTGTGACLTESDSICEYLEDRFPEPSLRPEDPEKRAVGRMLSRLLDLYYFQGISMLDAHFKAGGGPDARMDEGIAKIDMAMGWIEPYIPFGGGYAIGSRLSLADCALATGLFYTFLVESCGRDPYLGHARLRDYHGWIVANDPNCAAVIDEMACMLAKRFNGAVKRVV